MKVREVIADIGVGVIAGYAGTKLMERVTTLMYEWEPEVDRKREDSVRPGSPTEIAAHKTAQALGIALDEAQLKKWGVLFHHGIGMSWAPLYPFLRRRFHPLAAGLLTGLSLWAIVDEGLTPALGLSAPNSAYPFVTHLRGFVGHLSFGIGVMAAAEIINWLGRSGARRSAPR